MKTSNVATRSRSQIRTSTRNAGSSGAGRNLARGSRGPRVSRLQQGLRAAGQNLRVDGRFGPETAGAVRNFQRANGLKVDGIAGPNTLGALAQTVSAAPRTGTNPGAVTPGATTPATPGIATPTTASTHKATAPTAKPGSPANMTARFESTRFAGQRRQMKIGKITVNGNTYKFRSGGGGRGNLPAGDYKITPHMWSRSKRTMQVGGEGYSFAMSNKYDPRVRDTRTQLRIHPDGGGPGTIGCIGIVGDAATQRRFRSDMRAELKRNGGSFNLNVR